MGDGMTDSGWRGELGSDGNEEWLLDRLPMTCHQTSQIALRHQDAIARLQAAGKITVTRRDGWFRIRAKEG